ncbi:hypothetical protein K443DRAFT_679419 [Laccaria amethystina LaAM-08-1]|uniref:Uncharacterized protein n=1 Tax=Laccaria amethystina LaAM-08-1 TaxID=1095629 RepID=A0A0C9XR31_9AGAR|nr:hypothetical protein K443DRAFT_679419 [Laccaria amethystina LaAM-08-1]
MNIETGPHGDVIDTFHSPDNDPVRWHPKITIYRLLVLLTTICLGVGKAITSARGAVLVPVTLEWVSGVAVFILLYGVGSYDEDHRQRMKWLFNKDLAAYLWPISYRTDEVDLPAGFHLSRRPPITGYRIVVTASVLLFGLAKAMLGYLGCSVAANTVDWIYGVVVTSGLYCLGLYENNSLDLFSAFFAIDYGPSLRHVFFASVLAVADHSISIIYFSGIIYAIVRILVSPWIHPVLYVDPHMKMPFFDYVTVLCVDLVISEIFLIIAAWGVFGLYHTLYLIKKAVFPQGIRRGIRGALNISGAEELPAPYSERNDKYDVHTAEYIFQVFLLVFIGALTPVITRLTVFTTGSIVTTDGWVMVLLLLYPVVFTWIATFLSFRLFISLFVHTIRGSIFKQL